MAKSKAERMKDYRARKKALLGDEWLKKENERVKTYYVPISELSASKQEHIRTLNKKHKDKYRNKKKLSKCDENPSKESEENAVRSNSPSGSDENGISSTTKSTLVVKLPFPQTSRQSRGRKRTSRALAKQYRKNERLQEENKSLQRRLNSARKKLSRYSEQNITGTPSSPTTPRSKSDKLLRDAGIDPSTATHVRQKVLFAECISEEIKEAAKLDKSNVVKCVVAGKVIKKYRLKTTVGESTFLNRKRLGNVKKSIEIKKRSRNAMFNNKIANDVRNFLERDDNSRLLPGKADAVKIGKNKVQKRVLNDYMYNLHSKFQSESTYKISHATFCRKKPHSIAHVNFSTRSVCLCQKHQNFALKLRSLKNYKVTAITSPDKFMDTFNSEEALDLVLGEIKEPTVKYQEWRRVKMKDDKERMRVVDIELPKEDFINMMKKTYKEFVVHIHNVVEQYKGVKQMKEKLPVDHALIQMDFSENYCCQNMEEVQSAYWNSTAITLHPTVIYKKNPVTGELEHKCIVFVSEVLQHNASMVLAIVDEIVRITKTYIPGLKGVHFWTDSPTSQYRNKTVFDYISRLDTAADITSSWNFFEAGHGKGPCDGIGGTTKRNADNAIKQGKVIIQDAHDFFKWASEGSSTQIEYVNISQEQFDARKAKVDKVNCKPIKGTMKIHSVVAVAPGIVRTRDTICVCNDCFDENGFKESTKCLWTVQSMAKPQDNDGNSKKRKEKECNQINNDPAPKVAKKNKAATINDAHDQGSNQEKQVVSLKNAYVVVEYDKQCYIGKIVDVDKEDCEVEVNCMQECGKRESQFKWPSHADKIWLHERHVLKVIDSPSPTGRSKRLFTVDAETASFMKSYK